MPAKTPANAVAEIIVKLESENDSAEMQIDFLQNQIDANIHAIGTLAPLAEWVQPPTPEPIDETNTGETK